MVKKTAANECGLLCCVGDLLQVFNHRYWVLTIFSISFLFQQTLCNGFPSVIYRTLEIRFQLNSWHIGIISSCYEIADSVISVFLIHWLRNQSKPVSIGAGLVIAAIGGLIFTIPHFISDPYTIKESSYCLDNAQCEKYSNAVPIFLLIFGQLLVGAGSVTTHSFTPTYFDENVAKNEVPMYHSVWFAVGIIGPVLGFVAGGLSLNIHTDFHRDIQTPTTFTSDSPIWVGAWWLGMFICSIILAIVAFPVCCIPNELDSAEVQETNSSIRRKSLFQVLKMLFKNKTWLAATIGTLCDAWLIQCLAAFAVRYIMLTFRLSSGVAGLVGGGGLIVAAVVGYLISGIALRKVKTSDDHERLKSMTNFSLWGPVVSGIFAFGFFLRCQNPNINGVDFDRTGGSFESSSSSILRDSTLACDASNCASCDLSYYNPICDASSGKTFFSECFAGCNGTALDACTCTGSEMKSGYCEACPSWKFWVYILTFIVCMTGTYVNFVPLMNLGIQSVPAEIRSTSLAMQSVLARSFGSIPGPILFGMLLDSTCAVWEKNSCGKTGSCLQFDTYWNSLMFLGLILVTRIVCFITLLLLKSHLDKGGANSTVHQVAKTAAKGNDAYIRD